MNPEKFTLEISDLSVGYILSEKEHAEILGGLNFRAIPGELVALIGCNGIGKSTLLKTITGFLPSLKGSLKLNGLELTGFHQKELAQLMSFVSTENISVPNMTVFDLVSYGRYPYTNWFGKLSSNDKAEVFAAIEKVGLAGLENKPVDRISDGEKQRAMIARAIAQDTPVIILDEPSAFLDISNKYEIFHLILTLAHEKNKTIILSTHDLNIAMREVDKLWILTQNGNFEGAPEDAALNGWFERLFRNPNIGFDTQEGEFYFKKNFKSKVKVEGEGPEQLWMLKALNRRGYQIVVKAEPDFRITLENKKWKLISETNVTCLSTIYDVLAEMEKQTIL